MVVHGLKGRTLMKSFKQFISETYKDSGIGKWMSQSAGGSPGWDRYGLDGKKIGKCGDAKEGEAYAACLSPAKAKKLGKKGIASFVRRKRDAQKKSGDSAKGGEEKKGQSPTYVKTEDWSEKYKRSIDCNNPKGFSQKAHCAGRKKKKNNEAVKTRIDTDLEVLVVQNKDGEPNTYSSMEDAKKTAKKIQGKVIRGVDGEIMVQVLIDPSIRKHLDENSKNPGKEYYERMADKLRKAGYDLRKPINRKKAWDVIGSMAVSRLADKGYIDIEGGEGRQKRESVSESENEPTNPSLWKKALSKAKSKFDVYPSAYASAWASKWYKEQGGGWRKK